MKGEDHYLFRKGLSRRRKFLSLCSLDGGCGEITLGRDLVRWLGRRCGILYTLPGTKSPRQYSIGEYRLSLGRSRWRMSAARPSSFISISWFSCSAGDWFSRVSFDRGAADCRSSWSAERMRKVILWSPYTLLWSSYSSSAYSPDGVRLSGVCLPPSTWGRWCWSA